MCVALTDLSCQRCTAALNNAPGSSSLVYLATSSHPIAMEALLTNNGYTGVVADSRPLIQGVWMEFVRWL